MNTWKLVFQQAKISMIKNMFIWLFKMFQIEGCLLSKSSYKESMKAILNKKIKMTNNNSFKYMINNK